MTGNPERVRIADGRDEDELMNLCSLLHGENGVFEISEPKVRSMLRSALEGPVEQRRGIVGAIGPAGSIQGSIFLEIGQLWYSEDFMLSELWNYVLPQYRASSNSKDLIAFAKSISDRFRLPLMIGVLSNERTEAKIRHYRQQLGPPSGAFFVHGATTGRGVN